ncbi:hypothetical protein PV08_05169 [Exophiala spinifera]|uniref:Major facilitator superfamily (MFS) profile domain-containing protein n=1 Tax=Exophiala spinifera TaxID=91928 RepID=A0A0D2C2Z9_9EURO|nr:uncharacterized protein PV08_05169 [Exophiala spinifera]KIW17974.1 hypothetical protein PV08_05169 [Exophiala spinifera]
MASTTEDTCQLEKFIVTEQEEAANAVSFPASSGEDSTFQEVEEVKMTIKAWSYGFSFWIIPVFSAIESEVAVKVGIVSISDVTWWMPLYLFCNASSQILFASNSDLFGRRWFLIVGNILVFTGLLVIGAGVNTKMIMAGCVIQGIGAGLAQLAAFALPELLPNRLRHVGIVISDIGTWLDVVLGPVAGRYAIRHGDQWRWLFYGPAIGVAGIVATLYLVYYPPKHPRGIPWHQAIKNLDYGGAMLYSIGGSLVFSGIVQTTTIPASDPKVFGTLVSGFGVLVAFALYEHFMPLRAALTPPHIFAKDKGREFTFPFIAGTISNMGYFATNVAFLTQVEVFWTSPTSSLSYTLAIILPQNLGLPLGQVFVGLFGSKIRHWRTQYFVAIFLSVLFGTLLALGTKHNMALMMVFSFLCQFGFGYQVPLSMTFLQFGAPQTELGVSGGLAGGGKWTGAWLASSIYTTVLSNSLRNESKHKVPAAAIKAGLPAADVPALMIALNQGSDALEKVPHMTGSILAAARNSLFDSYTIAIRNVCLCSLGFGVVCLIAICLCQDITPKMTPKTEVFLENDINAEKNKYH